ncbi:MAG: C25 family cysteine peptidase [Pseudomonadota bacterium]|nr:C25 family cysteine peptidase [Pseudomonadota bacterium]
MNLFQITSTGVLLLWLGLTHITLAAQQVIRPTHMTEHGLLLELTLPDFDIETVAMTDNALCHRLHMAQSATTLTPGAPELPVLGTLIQVPKKGEVIAEIVAVETATLPKMDLCPLPTRQASSDGEIKAKLIKDEKAYQIDKFFPEQIVTLEAVGELRGVNVNRLRIFPFQWHPLTEELRYITDIQIQIHFEQPLERATRRAKPAEGHYDNLLRNSLINYVSGSAVASAKPQAQLQRREKEVEKATEKTTVRTMNTADSLRIEIEEEGMYELDYQQLKELGLQPQFIDPKYLQLFHQDEEVAIQVDLGEDGAFNDRDSIKFYAQNFEDNFTKTNVYWLYWRKKGLGQRIAQRDGTVTDATQVTEVFYEQIHLEEDRQEWLTAPGAPEKDFEFWERINAGEVKDYPFELPAPPAADTQVLIRVNLQGRSTAPPAPNHHTVIRLNGEVISEERWDGETDFIQEATVSAALFNKKENILTIEMAEVEAIVDVIYLNWIEIEYWRALTAASNHFTFTLNGSGRTPIRISDIRQPENMLVYDITHPNQVAEIINFKIEETAEKKTYNLLFEDDVPEQKRYLILLDRKTHKPRQMAPWQPTRLKSKRQGADYILITAEEFRSAVEPLGTLRRQQGLRAKIVSVEAIYNEFNHGIYSPLAIKAFLKYAYEHWQAPAPTYVFLVGDASISYNKRGSFKNNRVPTYLSYDSGDGLTPDDSWFVSLDDEDILPDMLVGRIPGNSYEMVTQLVNKIVGFEQSTRKSAREILLIADSEEHFENLNENLATFVPAEFSFDKIYLNDYFEGVERDQRETKIDEATEDIIASMNEGILVSNYIGHGVVDRWSASKGLFKAENVHVLANQEQLFFALMLTCINGYFVGGRESLAEEFILAEGGSIAAFAPSNVSYAWEDRILSEEIFTVLFEQNNRELGTITTQAKIEAFGRGTSENVIKMFTLFGDPATQLKAW